MWRHRHPAEQRALVFREVAGKEVERGSDGVVVFLSQDDVDPLITGLRETPEALEDWEFETRTGFQRTEVEWVYPSS